MIEKGKYRLLSNNRIHLKADCKKCFGLCCVGLHFSASEGFPIDKGIGEPCPNLQTDFTCSVHQGRLELGYKGCLAFDCFGAGQKVSQISFVGLSWREDPKLSNQMMAVFLKVRQLQEIIWYLTEALSLQSIYAIELEIMKIIDETEEITRLSPDALMTIDIEGHRKKVIPLLLQSSELARRDITSGREKSTHCKKKLGPATDLAGADLRNTNLAGISLRGACLIAADLRNVDLSGTEVIGADFRDANIKGADLSRSIYLTQVQVNVAKGDNATKLPQFLTPPVHWLL